MYQVERIAKEVLLGDLGWWPIELAEQEHPDLTPDVTRWGAPEPEAAAIVEADTPEEAIAIVKAWSSSVPGEYCAVEVTIS